MSTRSPGLTTLLAAGAIAWAAGCENDPTGPEETELPLILSDTAAQPAVPPPDLSTSQGTQHSSVAAAAQAAPGTNVAYISLPPGAVPNGIAITIRHRVTGSAITVPMVDGGFDPVAIEATAGDVLELEIQTTGGGPLLFTRVVPGRRPPKVVRTNPPPKKRDVALNSTIIIVFSEPLDAETLTDASVQLLRGAIAIAGRLEFRDTDRLTAAFIPLTPLTAGSDYRLVVTQGIRDRDGEALEAPITVEFRTRDAPGPSASVVRVPEDAATIQEGVDFVQAGGTVRVRAGTYPEAVEINKGVTIEAASETDAVVIAPPGATANAVTITTTDPVSLRRLIIDHPDFAPGTLNEDAALAIFGTGRVDITIAESTILRSTFGTYIENDSAVTGGRARLVIRNSIIDGGEALAMEGGVFAVSDVDAVIAENTVLRTTFSCIQIQGTANAEVIGNDVDMCGPFGGIRAPMDGPERVVNIIGNTVRNSGRSESRYGIFLRGATGVIERNTVIDYVQPNPVPGIDAAAIRLNDARATVRFNDISGNSHAGLRNDTPAAVDATCNWWGAADGPSGAGGGSGDAVVGAVAFAPFATAPIAATTETSCSGQVAPATQLAFTVEPTTTVVGRAIAPIVRVSARDALGRPTPGLTGTVTVALAVNPGGAILGGSRTVTAENGVATFFDLSLDQPASGYVLTASAVGLASANSAAFDVTAQSADVVSFSDFEGDAGMEWSHTRRSTVPNGRYPGRGFLGNFGCTDYQETEAPQADDCRAADLVTLRLAGLPAHDEVTITFDLYVIGSWDGNGGAARRFAPDLFNLSVAGGPTLLNTTFAVHPFVLYQSYPDQYPTDGSTPPSNARHTGAIAIDLLGYEMDAVYRLTFTFAHSAPTVTFSFTAPALEPLGNESWGLDNVEVKVGRRP